MKLKSARCSTGHGTGVMHEASLTERLARDKGRLAAKRANRPGKRNPKHVPCTDAFFGGRARTAKERERRAAIIAQNKADLSLW